jgi:hypothetical protein
MMRRKTHARVPVARLGLLVGVLLSLASMVGLGSVSEGWRDEIARRLAALRPERPAEYLALAEDLVDRASNGGAADADRAMARTLASLAGAIDVQGMGRSAALFLVENSSNDAQRSRMLAVAALLDPAADVRVEVAERTESVLALVRAFSYYRRGDGIRAKEALGRNDAAALLDRHPDILKGGSARFRADCDAMRSSGVPAMSELQVEALHALASGSIAGAPRSWSESLARIGPAPLPEVDLDDPRSLFGVDPELSVWDGKAWTPRAAAPAKLTAPAAKPRGR